MVKTKIQTIILSLCIGFFLITSVSFCKNKIQFKTDQLTFDLGGKFNNEIYSSLNLTFLNAAVPEDDIFYARTTFDLIAMFTQGEYEKPRIQFYDVLRFRFKWGTLADVKNNPGMITIGDTQITVPGTSTNKHLVWLRESWIKILLGQNIEHENYLQIGLIPYSVGRGISYGTAFDNLGFLGFNPGSSIDQYAPGILFSWNPIPDRFFVDAYAALTENNQTSLTENLAPIHSHELNACAKRGLGRQSFVVVLRSRVAMYQKGVDNITFEPYLVYQKAPDQDLEFTNDVDSFLTTAGLAIEGAKKRFSWGIEVAKNFGELDIKSWDRNYFSITVADNGTLLEQNTKVFTQDPSTTISPALAPNTSNVQAIIAGSPETTSENGQLIGTTTADQDPADTSLWNSFDRFRPAQVRYSTGYFFVADATYEFIPKAFNVSVGVGYASGYIDELRDTNKMSQEELMNEQFTAFIPLQSVYNGKRLRHLVLFNQGIPRFNTKLPNGDLSQRNVVQVLVPNTVDQFTNIAFLGVAFDWKIQALKKNEVNIRENVICYWSPETAQYAIVRGSEIATSTTGPINLDTIPTVMSNNFLGTELTTEFSGLVCDVIKISGYIGFFIPGSHYKDMMGTLIGKYKLPTGTDTAFVGNISVAYLF